MASGSDRKTSLDGVFLDEYNTTFQRLQQRRRIAPLAGGKPLNYNVPGPPCGWSSSPRTGSPRPSSPEIVIPSDHGMPAAGDLEGGEGKTSSSLGEAQIGAADDCIEDGASESVEDQDEEPADAEFVEETETDLKVALEEDDETLGLDDLEDVALEMDEEEVDEEEDDTEEMEEDARSISFMDILQTAGMV